LHRQSPESACQLFKHRDEHKDWGEQIGENRRPSELVRLSFIESREKDKEKSHKRSNYNAALLSLTLTVAAAGTLYLVTLDAMALAMTRDAHVIADVARHAAFGIFFRLQVTDFDRLLAFFSLCHSYFS